MNDQGLWVRMLRERNWTVYRFDTTGKHGLSVWGSAYFWDSHVDVVIIKDPEAAVAYRTPPCHDIFRPVHVTRIAAGPHERVLREALSWPAPSVAEPRAAAAPDSCAITDDFGPISVWSLLQRSDRQAGA